MAGFPQARMAQRLLRENKGDLLPVLLNLLAQVEDYKKVFNTFFLMYIYGSACSEIVELATFGNRQCAYCANLHRS